MLFARVHSWAPARVAALAAVAFALLAGDLTAASAGDLPGDVSAGGRAAAALQAQIAADSTRIHATADGLQIAQGRLAALQSDARAREAALRRVQSGLLFARDHLVRLENRMHQASVALAANLVARYENDEPDVTTVVLQSNGFSQLLEQLAFLRRLGAEDAVVMAQTRAARIAVRREVAHLASLEERDRTLTQQVLAHRNQVAAWQAALLTTQASQLRGREADKARLQRLQARVRRLEARAAAEAAAAAADTADTGPGANTAGPSTPTGGAPLVAGGIAVDTGGMVQPPSGAPAAVAQIIAAGNAIATLPYVWGGGHGSFQANGYDCSGSVSYALAAAGLVTSPMVSGDFASYGDPGPGRWVTIYANADHVWMEVAGWRFDTVAQAYNGTRWAQGGGEFDGFVVRHPPGL